MHTEVLWSWTACVIRTGAAAPGPARGTSACRTERTSHRETLQLMQIVSAHKIFTIKQILFLPQVPLYAFPVRVSGFRLDSQSRMYLGNMQITVLLAEPTSWKTEVERTVKSTAEWDILYRNIWLHSIKTYTHKTVEWRCEVGQQQMCTQEARPFTNLRVKALTLAGRLGRPCPKMTWDERVGLV